MFFKPLIICVQNRNDVVVVVSALVSSQLESIAFGRRLGYFSNDPYVFFSERDLSKANGGEQRQCGNAGKQFLHLNLPNRDTRRFLVEF